MSNSLPEAISLSHSSDIYLPTRSIFLLGDIDEDMHEKILKNLHVLDNMNSGKTINLFINSGGGCIDSGIAIFDAIKSCKNYVRGIVNGQASSAASVILQACDTREMTPNSIMLVHVGTESYSTDHPENIRRHVKRSDEVEKWCRSIYMTKIKAKKPRFTYKQLDSLLKFDTIVSSKECLDLGLVDEIKETF